MLTPLPSTFAQKTTRVRPIPVKKLCTAMAAQMKKLPDMTIV